MPEKAGMVNQYDCDTCHDHIITKTIHDGTTPFMLECYATAGCKGIMRSRFYRVPQDFPHTHEWFVPDLENPNVRRKYAHWLEHVKKGGLVIREVSMSNKRIER